MSKRNAALEALSAPIAPNQPRLVIAQAADDVSDAVKSDPAPPKSIDKVMLYLPPKVARKFKEMAFHEDCKAHDLYLQALAAFLRKKGHAAEADLLAR
jgi:hypothetical protein